VLACSFLLALPQGWCCLFAIELAQITAETTPAKPVNCCKCQQHSQTPSPNDKPSERPQSPCPCSDRQTVLTHSPSVEKGSLDLALVAILPVPESLPGCIGIDPEAVCVVHPPTSPLHIFKCVWTC